jgi:hypothetical protein
VPILLGGALAIVLVIGFVPTFQMNLLGALLILVLGLPVLGRVLARHRRGRLDVVPALGHDHRRADGDLRRVPARRLGGPATAALALMVGAIVCIAISNAGTCSQDLKTGYLLGATPVKQQGALLIGVLTSVLAVGWTPYLLNRARRGEAGGADLRACRPSCSRRGDSSRAWTAQLPLRAPLRGRRAPAAVAPGRTWVDPARARRAVARTGLASARARSRRASAHDGRSSSTD